MDTPGNTFDDKRAVVNASMRGEKRGIAVPLLLDLARKPVSLHDNSVPVLQELLHPNRGAIAPHPFYVADATMREEVAEFLRGSTTGRREADDLSRQRSSGLTTPRPPRLSTCV